MIKFVNMKQSENALMFEKSPTLNVLVFDIFVVFKKKLFYFFVSILLQCKNSQKEEKAAGQAKKKEKMSNVI